jgi:hypothetical protein
MALPFIVRMPWSLKAVKTSAGPPLCSAMCRGHRRRTGQSGTKRTLSSVIAISLESSAVDRYSTVPIPMMESPDAMPCKVVGGWVMVCTGNPRDCWLL